MLCASHPARESPTRPVPSTRRAEHSRVHVWQFWVRGRAELSIAWSCRRKEENEQVVQQARLLDCLQISLFSVCLPLHFFPLRGTQVLASEEGKRYHLEEALPW